MSPPASASRPVTGILLMVLTGLLFVGVIAGVKHVGRAVPAAEAGFLRFALALVFLLPMIPSILRAHLTHQQLQVFALRGAAHAIGVIFWFFAMSRISLAEVTALNYLNPVYVTLGAALFLGEKLPPRRLAAVIMALIGALVILRPGLRALGPGHFAMLVAAGLFAVSYLLAKRLTVTASPLVVVGMFTLTVTIGLAPFAAAVWVTPGWDQLGWLFMVAAFATAGHYTMTLAFAAAPLTVTQPVVFLQLVWAVTLGATVFGEPVDVFVVIGGLIIVASVSFITWREAVARRQFTPVAPDTKI